MLVGSSGFLLIYKPSSQRRSGVHKNQAVGQQKPDCCLLSVSGSHMLTGFLLLLIDSTMSSLCPHFLSLSHVSFMYVHTLTCAHRHRQFPLCRKRQMGCSQTTGAALLVFCILHSTAYPAQVLLFLPFSPVVTASVPQDCGVMRNMQYQWNYQSWELDYFANN